MRGSVDTVKQALADALEEIWEGVPESLLESLNTARWQKISYPPCIKRHKHCILANFVWGRSMPYIASLCRV